MSTVTKKRPTQVVPLSPDDFDLVDDLDVDDQEDAPIATAPAAPVKKPVKKVPGKKLAPKKTTDSSEPKLEVPKRKRGAPKGRRSNMENPGEARPEGHKGKVAVFYGDEGGHRWAIYGRNGRKIAISGAVFSTFQPAVDSVNSLLGTDHKPIKDSNGYQTIDL